MELNQRLASIELAFSAKSSQVRPEVQPYEKSPDTPIIDEQEYFTCINIDPGIIASNVDHELHFAGEVVVEEYAFEDQEAPQYNEEDIDHDQDREPSHKVRNLPQIFLQ